MVATYGYNTCLDNNRTRVQMPAQSLGYSKYVIGLIPSADTKGSPTLLFINVRVVLASA